MKLSKKTDMTKEKNKTKESAAVELGRLGGKAVVKKRGKAYMKKIGKRGAKIRWASKKT